MRSFSTSACAQIVLVARPRASGRARAFVRETVAGENEELVADVALLTSELVTNAVIHARTPIEVGVAHDGERILVAVADRDLARPEQQPYSTERAGGRGLVIVRELSDSWGVTTYETGKAVWFTVRRKTDATGKDSS